MKERRKHPRRKGFWRAFACLPGRAPLSCIVRDISEGGARLEFAEALRFPPKFRLFIEAHNIEYHCEVRHVSANSVGVFFYDRTECQSQDYLGHFGRRREVPDVNTDETFSRGDAMTNSAWVDGSETST